LIAHLAAFAGRKLHRARGYSLFRYCTEELSLSEHAAFNRMAAARAGRSFPLVLDLLAEGAVNLATVRLLAPHLTRENHERLLAEARGRSKREVQVIVARIAPQADVRASVRKLPAPRPATAGAELITIASMRPSSDEAPALSSATPGVVASVAAGAPAQPTLQTTAPRPVVTPLSPERYRIQFTVGKETQDKLRQVQDLLRREIPDGDPGAIFDRALTLLLEDVARKKLAATPKPRPSRGSTPGSRHVPAAVKRKVWIRDHAQCAFVSPAGRRCRERAFLEFHHVDAYALGGEATVDNISLRCREHNAYEAELLFGPWDPAAVREMPAAYSTWSGATRRKAQRTVPDSPRGELRGSADPAAASLLPRRLARRSGGGAEQFGNVLGALAQRLEEPPC
jgi:hypothetical protein